MALNIPNVGSNIDTLFQGLNTGSDLIHKMMLNRYYSEPHASGDVANAAYVESLRNKYGEQDPRYLEAKRAHDLTLKGRESLMDYRGTLMDTAGIRATSPLGKLIAEGKGEGATDILKNRRRGGGSGVMMGEHPEQQELMDKWEHAKNNPRTPEEREAYERKITKETSDEQARKVLRRAENLDKTRASINVEDLTRYSGPKGALKHAAAMLQQARGNPSKEFIANQEAVNSASLMADQMRQFYEDSIQPSAMERLRELSNPSAWYKDPKVAQAQFKQLNDILDKETATYEKHGTSPIRLNALKFENGKFKLGESEGKPQSSIEDMSNPGGSYDLAAVEKELININPKYTAKNIKDTATALGKSPDEIVLQIYQKLGK